MCYLTVELDFKIARIYLQSNDATEFFFLYTNFRLEAKCLVIKKRCERGNRTAVNGFSLRAVDFTSQPQRYYIFWIYLCNSKINIYRKNIEKLIFLNVLHKTKMIYYWGLINYHLQQDTGVEAVGTIIVVDVNANSVKILQRTVNSSIKRKSKVFVQRLVTGLYIKVQVLVTLPHYTTVCVHVLRSDNNATTSICIIPIHR